MSDFKQTLRRALGERMRESDDLCREVWSALANVSWYHPASHAEASYSFRAAGALISEIKGTGHYMDWYCSGPDATVTDQIRRMFKKEGWIADAMPEICDEPECLDDATCGWSNGTQYRRTCGAHMGAHVPKGVKL